MHPVPPRDNTEKPDAAALFREVERRGEGGRVGREGVGGTDRRALLPLRLARQVWDTTYQYMHTCTHAYMHAHILIIYIYMYAYTYLYIRTLAHTKQNVQAAQAINITSYHTHICTHCDRDTAPTYTRQYTCGTVARIREQS